MLRYFSIIVNVNSGSLVKYGHLVIIQTLIFLGLTHSGEHVKACHIMVNKVNDSYHRRIPHTLLIEGQSSQSYIPLFLGSFPYHKQYIYERVVHLDRRSFHQEVVHNLENADHKEHRIDLWSRICIAHSHLQFITQRILH